MNNIAALVSGGVDSSVAVHFLKNAGYDPDLYYIRINSDDDDKDFMSCSTEEDLEICRWLARHYGLRFEMVDLHRDYWDNVVKYTIDSVKAGLTPNPDVMCNKLIKFGVFNDRYGQDYDTIATGHYATTKVIDGIKFIAIANDPVKDQTDFLSQLSYEQIKKIECPIGKFLKTTVRDIAEAAGLPSAGRKDSQGICFLGKINYNDFIKKYLGEMPGNIVEFETGKILGKHHGYWFHTIGQRKGLNLPGGPWFVVKKDIADNVIYVSKGYNPDNAKSNTIKLTGFHYLAPINFTPVNIMFKIRHTPEFHKAQLEYYTETDVVIHSDDMIMGVAPGQYATIYDPLNDTMIATGMITM